MQRQHLVDPLNVESWIKMRSRVGLLLVDDDDAWCTRNSSRQRTRGNTTQRTPSPTWRTFMSLCPHLNAKLQTTLCECHVFFSLLFPLSDHSGYLWMDLSPDSSRDHWLDALAFGYITSLALIIQHRSLVHYHRWRGLTTSFEGEEGIHWGGFRNMRGRSSIQGGRLKILLRINLPVYRQYDYQWPAEGLMMVHYEDKIMIIIII